PFSHTQQIVFPQDAVYPFGVHFPAPPPQFRRDPRPSVAGPFQRDSLNGIAQVHVWIRHCLAILVEAVEDAPSHAAQPQHAIYRQSPVVFHFFLVLPVDRGFPVNACSIRFSSMRCKHSFKKSISTVSWPTLRPNSATLPSDQRDLPLPGNALPAPRRNSRLQRCSTLGLTSNARATSAIETPCSSRRTPGILNSFLNCLRDNPMTHSPFNGF